jgi:glycosyltransferase involved in cell wall biosynthesis
MLGKPSLARYQTPFSLSKNSNSIGFRMLAVTTEAWSTYQLPVVVIPAFEPQNHLIATIEQIRKVMPHCFVVVVDDGSSESCKWIFQKIRSAQTIVLRHAINLGKGQALKTAFNYCLNEFPQSIGFVTADADGQHKSQDIASVFQEFIKNPASLCLGARKFNQNVPFRSLFGNSLTRKILSFTTGLQLRDTQTGLRGIPRKLATRCLKVSSSGYEFELDMLLKAREEKLPIREVTIETIYENNNQSSHFNPVVDSLKIYFVFLRFISSSLLAATLDAILFAFIFRQTQSIGIGLVAGRVIIGGGNYFINKTFVFHSKRSVGHEALEFALLTFSLMLISFCMINIFSSALGISVYLSKIFAECLVFLMNFSFQRWVIFRRSVDEEPSN